MDERIVADRLAARQGTDPPMIPDMTASGIEQFPMRIAVETTGPNARINGLYAGWLKPSD